MLYNIKGASKKSKVLKIHLEINMTWPLWNPHFILICRHRKCQSKFILYIKLWQEAKYWYSQLIDLEKKVSHKNLNWTNDQHQRKRNCVRRELISVGSKACSMMIHRWKTTFVNLLLWKHQIGLVNLQLELTYCLYSFL